MVNVNMKFLRKLNGFQQSQMADLVGVAASKWSDYERMKGTPPLPDLLKIADFFRVDFREFVESDLSKGKVLPISENTENGKVSGKENGKVYPENNTISLVTEPNLARTPQVVTVDTYGNDRAVLVPARARAGYLAGYADPEYIETLPTYDLPAFRGSQYRLFEVQGSSMHPTLNDKDIVIGQFVEDLRQLRDDRVHVVVTRDEGIVVKRVLNRLEKENVIVLKSDNHRERDIYPTKVLYTDEIDERVLEVWHVAAYLSSYVPTPNDQYIKLNDMEVQLNLIADRLNKAGL